MARTAPNHASKSIVRKSSASIVPRTYGRPDAPAKKATPKARKPMAHRCRDTSKFLHPEGLTYNMVMRSRHSVGRHANDLQLKAKYLADRYKAYILEFRCCLRVTDALNWGATPTMFDKLCVNLRDGDDYAKLGNYLKGRIMELRALILKSEREGVLIRHFYGLILEEDEESNMLRYPDERYANGHRSSFMNTYNRLKKTQSLPTAIIPYPTSTKHVLDEQTIDLVNESVDYCDLINLLDSPPTKVEVATSPIWEVDGKMFHQFSIIREITPQGKCGTHLPMATAILKPAGVCLDSLSNFSSSHSNIPPNQITSDALYEHSSNRPFIYPASPSRGSISKLPPKTPSKLSNKINKGKQKMSSMKGLNFEELPRKSARLETLPPVDYASQLKTPPKLIVPGTPSSFSISDTPPYLSIPDTPPSTYMNKMSQEEKELSDTAGLICYEQEEGQAWFSPVQRLTPDYPSFDEDEIFKI